MRDPVADAVDAAVDETPVAEAVESGSPTEVDEESDAAAATKGLLLLPPVPVVRSSEKDVSELCCEMLSETSVLSSASPDFEA